MANSLLFRDTFEINVGTVIAATTPIIPRVIRTSASVKPNLAAIGSEVAWVTPSARVKPDFFIFIKAPILD